MYIRCSLLFVVLTISWLKRASTHTNSSSNLLLDQLTKSCPSDGIPVCGVRNKQFVLFSNGCLLNEVNKDLLQGEALFKRVPLQYCMYGCHFECDKIYKPVCAVNVGTNHKQLFNNQCELMKYVCKTNLDDDKISISECLPKTNLKSSNKLLEKRSHAPKGMRRPVPCTNVFKPVCGSYMGVKSSFKSECVLNAENVMYNKNWRIVSNGLCPEDYLKIRRHKFIPTKPHSIKKRSFYNNIYNQEEHEYNANNFVDSKNPENFSPNDFYSYVYMPPTFPTQFLNHEDPSYQLPMPVHESYDEILNKIITIPLADLPSPEEENELEIENPTSQISAISPVPFAVNRMNFNDLTNRDLAHDINQQLISPAIKTSAGENEKEYCYDFKKIDPNIEKKDIEKIPKSTVTSMETTQIPQNIFDATNTPKALSTHKQLKREDVLKKSLECKFGSLAVCATLANGTIRTFETICEMMSTNVHLKNEWTKLHEGVCDDCKYNCSREYQPICVSRNGVNYTMVNECYYNMGICMDKKSQWQLLNNGECERHTRVADKYENLKPGFPYTSDYFVAETTSIPISTASFPLAATSKSLKVKYNKSKKRRPNFKRAIRKSLSSQKCCSRSHNGNIFPQANMKCKCWSDTTQAPFTKLLLNGTQTESHIMRLVKDRDVAK